MEGKAIKKRVENDKGHKPKNCPNKIPLRFSFWLPFKIKN
jgi:hypothetical protein